MPATQTCPSCASESPARFRLCGYCGVELRPDVQQEVRRPVTILFSDLKGSTSLGEATDSEALFEVLSRYFDAMRAHIERHGGKIEKLIGDAIMAVFGLPVAHPDDPLRAVAAAVDCNAALASLNDELELTYGIRLTNRTGVATGHATVGLPSVGEHVLTGQVVELAMELEAAAPAGEILVGDRTAEAVRGEILLEEQMPIACGDAGIMAASYRVLGTAAGAPPAATEGPTTPIGSEPEGANGVPTPADAGAAHLVVCPNCGEQNPPDFTYCGMCGAALAGQADTEESRKTVTIVFTDVKARDAEGRPLAPQVLRSVMSRAFEAVQGVLGRYGGRAEKFIGDAVVAVFGLPLLHEDDAVRAARAALAIQRALADLDSQLRPENASLGARIGINTGLVVAGDATPGLHLVTGDAVNTAARLEQAAPENGVLLGRSTYQLVAEAVEAQEIEPLQLKGKSSRVAAYRLLGLREAGEQSRRGGWAMVGRAEELAHLRTAFHDSVAQNTLRLVTIVGDAGVGKSRLAREFEHYLGATALVLRGRCLAYGEGITFWPVIEHIRAAAEIHDEDPPVEAYRKLLGLVEARDVADRLASIAGLTEASFPLVELFAAVRRFFEILARRRPLVVVVDGVHWAEPSLVDLVDYLLSSGWEAPVTVVCIGRHELLEQRPDWADNPRATRVLLQPLSQDEAAKITDAILGAGGHVGDVQRRIVEAAQGNPLFIEQMVSMLIDSGALRFDEGRWIKADESADISVPPSIQALLAARVDQLTRDERSVIEPAAVIGYDFAQPAIEALVSPERRPSVEPRLGALVERRFVRHDPAASTPAEAWYRFMNLLIRDAAYEGLLKRSRVTLHERYVAWADEVNRERGREREFEEILGYHLEQAYRYRTEFGPPDAEATAVGRDAARRLSSAASRAFARGDMAAAAALFRRASNVLPTRDVDRLALLPELGEALMELGEFEAAGSALDEVTTIADELGEVGIATHARLMQLLVALYQGGDVQGWSGRAEAIARAAVTTFQELGDHAGLTRAWRILFGVSNMACRWGAATDAAEEVMMHARLANNRRQEARGATGYAHANLFGPRPVPQAIERCREALEAVEGDRRTEAMVLLAIAELEGMAGEFEVARNHYQQARTMLNDLGKSILSVSTSMNTWRVDALAGDLEVAQADLRRDYDALEQMGERYTLSSLAAFLGQVELELGHVDEAGRLAARARELTDADDILSQALWRSLEARVLAARGQFAEAIALAEAALEVLRPTDSPVTRADVLSDQGAVLALAGRVPEACSAYVAALQLHEMKGNRSAGDRARSTLAGLVGPAVAIG